MPETPTSTPTPSGNTPVSQPSAPATPATPAPSTPVPITPPAQTPKPEEVTGKQDVMGDAFLTEDEKKAKEKAETPGTTTPETPATPPATSTPPAGEKLLAGKYKTEEELKSAFIELGGDPSKYDTTEKLEEAYGVRESEFSRVRHEQANLDRLNKGLENPQPPTGEEGVNKMLAQVDWTKVNDAKDLASQLLTIIFNNLPNNKPLTEEELATRVAPMIADREKKFKELTDLEGRVPRLKADKNFRNAFATFIRGQKDAGTFKSLEQTMTDFLGVNQAIIDENANNTTAAAAGKAAAQTPTETGEGAGTASRGGDEADDILSAYADYKGHNPALGI